MRICCGAGVLPAKPREQGSPADETSAPHPIPFVFFILLVLTASVSFAEEQKPDLSDQVCFECHADPGMDPFFVDSAKFKKSVHASNQCISCHDDITEVPHPEGLKKVDCSGCHSDETQKYFESTHGKAYAGKIPDAPYCISCHGKHDILPKSNPDSKTHPLHQIEICTTCHSDPRIANKYFLPTTDKIEAYKTSIHGRGVLQSGLLVSATCVSCHSAHNVRSKVDPKSTIYWKNIPKLCGTCHLGILEDFEKSEHGKKWKSGSRLGPGCVTCHGSHGIEDPVTVSFQLQIPSLCSDCHEKNGPSYFDTFHGQAISLGFGRAATCANCHTAHRNLKASDPLSTVSQKHLTETCKQCHPEANARFVTFDPHADPNNEQRSPLLYYIYHAMALLLSTVFGFFTIHTLLWLQRSIVGYFRGEFKRHDPNGQWVMRFSLSARIVHALIMISFLGLAFTGLPLRFHFAEWPKNLVSVIGGLEVTRFFHRFFAVLTFGYASYHLAYLLWAIVFKKQRRLLYGPWSMVPRPKDFKDLFHQIRWFFYLGKPAKVDRWSYWEKFDYFAVFWGVPVIGLSGLMLWFPRLFTNFLPGYVLNIAKIIHSEEALLAVGFIFVFHFFHTHLRPEAFPMDLVMFTGRMPLERFKKERPEEYERLVKSGELEQYLTTPPTHRQKMWGYIGGTLGLGVGIFLIIQIIFSALKYQ